MKIEEEFEDDKATIEFLNAQKPSTKATYRKGWKFFLAFTEMTGNQILESRKIDTESLWEKKTLAFKDWILTQKRRNGKNYSGGTATTYAIAVRGFFGYHRQDLKFRTSERTRLTEFERETEDYRFSRENLKAMHDIADLQGKYIVTVGKSFGLRVGDFLKLTRGDLEPYLDREVPISLGEISTKKEKVKACPFIDSDALPIIKAMIQQMNMEGRTDPSERMLQIGAEQANNILQKLTKQAGIKIGNKKVRFHSLRKYLSDRLASHMAESKWKQIIGKKIDEKAYISPDLLRDDYARAMADTCWAGIPETDIEKRMTIAILKRDMEARVKQYGLTKDDLKEMFVTFDLEDYEKWLREHPEMNQPIGGGLPFEVQAKKALAEIILGAFEELKKMQKTGEES